MWTQGSRSSTGGNDISQAGPPAPESSLLLLLRQFGAWFRIVIADARRSLFGSSPASRCGPADMHCSPTSCQRPLGSSPVTYFADFVTGPTERGGFVVAPALARPLARVLAELANPVRLSMPRTSDCSAPCHTPKSIRVTAVMAPPPPASHARITADAAWRIRAVDVG